MIIIRIVQSRFKKATSAAAQVKRMNEIAIASVVQLEHQRHWRRRRPVSLCFRDFGCFVFVTFCIHLFWLFKFFICDGGRRFKLRKQASDLQVDLRGAIEVVILKLVGERVKKLQLVAEK